MLLSIITATQNNEDLIDRAIQSVVAQTQTDWELIVVNDGSTDSTADHVARWARQDARIQLINQTAAGVSTSRNRALQAASGDYVLFLDGDDWFELGAFAKLAPVLTAKTPDILIFNSYGASSLTHHEASNSFSQEADWTAPEAVEQIARYCATQYGEAWPVWYGNLHTVWGRCYRRELIMTSAVVFDTTLTVAEDWKFNLELFTKAKSVSIRDYYLYNYFDNDASIMHVHRWQGHANYIVSYLAIAAFLEQSNVGKALLPYVAVDQIRDEFRLIAQSRMGLFSGSSAVRAVSHTTECRLAVEAVAPPRLKRHDRLIRKLLQHHIASPIWGIFYYQERFRPMVSGVIHKIIPRRG